TGQTVYRLILPADRHARLDRDGGNWVLALLDRPSLETALQVAAVPRADGGGYDFSIPVTQAGSVISFQDTDVGDVLQIVPLGKPSTGIQAGRNYAQVAFLETAQGIVLQPFVDTVSVNVTPEAVLITTP